MKLLRHSLLNLVLVIGLLALSALACNFGQALQGATTSTPTAVPVSTEAAGRLLDNWQRSMDEFRSTGTFTFTVDEQQLTSWIVYNQSTNTGDIVITNPSVQLRDGVIRVNGDFQAESLDASAELVFTIRVNENGMLAVDLQSAVIGPLPVPDFLLTQIEDTANQLIVEEMRTTDFRLESVSVGDGVLVISGGTR